MPVASSQTAMMALPSEVVEEMLVYLAEQGDSLSISRLAQTCHRFRELVYDPLDKFLWRRVFLTSFDDPRASNDETLLGEAPTFDWGEEFRARVWAQSYIRRRINKDKEEGGRSISHRLRLKSRTSPSPDESESFGKALHNIIRVLDTTARAIRRDIEPENPGTTLSAASLGDADNRSPTGPLPVDADERSKNVAWLAALTAEGLPREFNPRFSQTDKDSYWSTSSDVQAVHKIVAQIGVHFEKTWADQPSLFRTSPTRAHRCEMVSTEMYDMTPDELFLRARFLARRQVFDVSYLSRRRHWGPFLPYRGPERDGDGQEDLEDFEDSDSDDSDYIPTTSADDKSPAAVRWGRRKADPAPENLRADWIHLAAIRIVAQASLQEHFQWAEIRDTLLSMDSFRAGAWIPRSPARAVTEWDWAGVEGVWRRCVCWLDYSDLYHHNQHGFRDPDFDEATIVVPLTIHIVGYSPATVPGYEHCPTIHIEGQMGGSEWMEGTDARRSYGTVGVIGDGSVRWATVSSVHGSPNEDEWSSEGVQIGGPGSAAGVLGLWTGAQHDADDPLGAWWQWRVA